MSGSIRDPQFWLQLAAKTRAKAEAYSLPKPDRVRILQLAEAYERLAERAMRRQAAAGGRS